MKVFGGTNVGQFRTENQDRVVAKMIDNNTALAVVCDGMGGESSGSVASEIACNEIFDRISSAYNDGYNRNMLKNLLVSTLVTVNSIVYDTAVNNPSYKGMGTTAVVALVRDNTLFAVNVGDSRAYIIDQNITQVTKDHSVVMKMYEDGEITKEEIKNHPKKNLITKAIGVRDSISPDYFEYDLDEGSYVLLCSDGLSGFVEEDKILEIFKNNSNREIAAELINQAMKNEGRDNITVAIIK